MSKKEINRGDAEARRGLLIDELIIPIAMGSRIVELKIDAVKALISQLGVTPISVRKEVL